MKAQRENSWRRHHQRRNGASIAINNVAAAAKAASMAAWRNGSEKISAAKIMAWRK
jgi:hypothetical protein